ncbi:hypothetical protein LG634_27175 [Streptomyces bambusae]|uniref:hypothetical protein n=1 Tax=Streptomyces bambusae TaxID=1550616 RepID=UPI001CFD238E|nr:hypothetical protein [Streptomyces bambusae]MCB5168492.1 hypothetical protein [Streptomyces bambusae]
MQPGSSTAAHPLSASVQRAPSAAWGAGAAGAGSGPAPAFGGPAPFAPAFPSAAAGLPVRPVVPGPAHPPPVSVQAVRLADVPPDPRPGGLVPPAAAAFVFPPAPPAESAQRQTDPDTAVWTAPVQREPDPPSPPAQAAAPPAPAESTDALVRRLIGPLSRLLRAELRLDRERAGVRLDPRH